MTEEQNPVASVKVFSFQETKIALQSAVYQLMNKEPFYGSLLQELTVKVTEQVPTAGIAYNVKAQGYEVYINPSFFCSLTVEERVAVFHHEVLHFTNKHLFRLPFTADNVSNEDKRVYNIAGDMAINQFIKNLPTGCVDYKTWKLDDGSVFPPFKTMEQYYELIKAEEKKQKDNKPKEDKNGKPMPATGTKGNVEEKLGDFKDFDQHMWDNLDEETKKKMLDEAKKVLKRSIEKTSHSYTKVPDSISDLLKEIDVLAAGLNYKAILKAAIKRTVSCADREATWKRPNKRYGVVSPGTRMGALPQLSMYADSSGSISMTELNQAFGIISEFLKVGVRTCNLGLWHTNLYYKKKYKLNSKVQESDLQSGGTDVNCVMNDILKSKPDLSIIITDGYYDISEVKPTSEVIWIISENGTVDHPMKHIGKTIKLSNLK